MKRILITTVLTLAIMAPSFGKKLVTKGESNTSFGKFTIEELTEPILLTGREMKAFTITYDKTGVKLTVAVDKNRKETAYYVLSPEFSVRYVNNGKYFGISMLEPNAEKEGFCTNVKNMNMAGYFHQKVMADATQSNTDYLELIASYFPVLCQETK